MMRSCFGIPASSASLLPNNFGGPNTAYAEAQTTPDKSLYRKRPLCGESGQSANDPKQSSLHVTDKTSVVCWRVPWCCLNAGRTSTIVGFCDVDEARTRSAIKTGKIADPSDADEITLALKER